MAWSYDALFIDGQWTKSDSGEWCDVLSAATEDTVGTIPRGCEADVDRAVAAARQAFDDPSGWSRWAPHERADAMTRLARAIERRSDEFVRRVSTQNGMPVTVGRQTEGAVPAALLRYYAEIAPELLAEDERRSRVAGTTLVRKEPLGVVAAIVPWNFPQSLTFFKLAPALAAGCTVVLKPAPETTVDALLLAEAAEEARLPPGVLNIVTGEGDPVGTYLVGHPGVDKVAFTGSTRTGREIAERCGRLLRPVTLELGGKSAGILLDDADLARVRKGLFSASLLNNGQTCFISTRILVPRHRYDEVVDAVTAMAASLPVGDPLDPATLIGPLASDRQRRSVEAAIASGIADGGQVTTGGGRPPGLDRGFFVEPTVFAGLDNSAAISRNEVFGPVLVVIPYDGDDDAVRLANDSDYGLGGTVWTSDPDRGAAIARRVRTGAVGVNGFTLDPGAPFGGVKTSGLGRELGPEGLTAYTELKSIYLPAR